MSLLGFLTNSFLQLPLGSIHIWLRLFLNVFFKNILLLTYISLPSLREIITIVNLLIFHVIFAGVYRSPAQKDEERLGRLEEAACDPAPKYLNPLTAEQECYEHKVWGKTGGIWQFTSDKNIILYCLLYTSDAADE